jgi:GNAT superfamily N-acetyltransferase
VSRRPEIVPLAATQEVDQFRCGKPELDVWLRRHALTSQHVGGARTFVTCEGTVVRGSYALAVSSVEFSMASAKVQRGLGRYPISVILIARLAVDERVQGQGVGSALLLDALVRCVGVAGQVGVRAVLVYAIDDDARSFYERYDFERSPTDPYHLLLTIQDIAAALL